MAHTLSGIIGFKSKSAGLGSNHRIIWLRIFEVESKYSINSSQSVLKESRAILSENIGIKVS